MFHVDAETIHRLLDYPGLVEALRQAHRQAAQPQLSTDVMLAGANAFVSLVAWAPDDMIAVKLVGVFPGNGALAAPEPSVQGLVTLFSGSTGRPLMTGDGAALTYRKTAADSALGADYLARKDARMLLVIGAGGLAPHVIAAHLAVRSTLERVLIWNRTHAKARDLAESLSFGAVAVSAVEDLHAALSQADIVSCVTMAKEPLVRGDLLKRGTHVDLIGAYSADMREADDVVVRRAGAIFVDTRINCEGSGDIAEPLRRGLITRAGIVADFLDLAGGRHPGRSSDDQITMFKNVGGGHLDLFTTRYLYQRMKQIDASPPTDDK